MTATGGQCLGARPMKAAFVGDSGKRRLGGGGGWWRTRARRGEVEEEVVEVVGVRVTVGGHGE